MPASGPRPFHALLIGGLMAAALLLPPRGTLVAASADDPAPPTRLERLTPWLLHADWTVRSMAALDLRTEVGEGAVALAARALANHQHPYADALILKALAGRPRSDLVAEGGPLLVDALLKRFDDPHPAVGPRSRKVLAQVPTLQLKEEKALYLKWWKRARKSLVLEQKRLRAERQRARAGAKPKARLPGTASVQAGELDDRFYEYLERVRRDGLELCVVLDHTGSMASVIGAAKAESRRLVERLRSYIAKFRAGLVTYDDGPWLRVPLTNNPIAIEKAFRRVGAAGGGDYEEGVDQGVFMALRQEQLGWSRSAQRVLVIVGDAPPHGRDLPRLVRFLQTARKDPLFDHPVIVHTISTNGVGVADFPAIARAGGGQHVTLDGASALVEQLLVLTFGGIDKTRVRRWTRAIDALRKQERKASRPARSR